MGSKAIAAKPDPMENCKAGIDKLVADTKEIERAAVEIPDGGVSVALRMQLVRAILRAPMRPDENLDIIRKALAGQSDLTSCVARIALPPAAGIRRDSISDKKNDDARPASLESGNRSSAITPTRKRSLPDEKDGRRTKSPARSVKRHRYIRPQSDSDLSDEETRRGRRSSTGLKRKTRTDSAERRREKRSTAKVAETTKATRADDREQQPGRAGDPIGPIANRSGDRTWTNQTHREPVRSDGNLRNRLGAYELPKPVLASGIPRRPSESEAGLEREALPIRKAADQDAYLRPPETERGRSSLARHEDALPANIQLKDAFRRVTGEQLRNMRRREINALRATGALNAKRAHEVFCHLPDSLLFRDEELIEGNRREITCRCWEAEIKAENSGVRPPGFWYGQRLDVALLRDERGERRGVAVLERQSNYLSIAEAHQLTDVIQFIAAVIRSVRDRQTRDEREQTVRVRLTAEFEAIRQRRSELGDRVEVESGAAMVDFGKTSIKLHIYVQGLVRRLASVHLDIADGGRLFIERLRHAADAHNRFPFNGEASASLRHRGWIDDREMHGFYSRVEHLDDAGRWVKGRYLHLAEEAVGYYIEVNGQPMLVKKLRGSKDNPRKKDGDRTVYLR